MMSILSSRVNVVDLMRTKFGESPATFGRIGEDGNGIEKVLTLEEQTK